MATDPKAIPAVEIAFRTDPGRDPEKQVNEDAAFYTETKHGLLAVVCDGMGGHAGGKEASELATKTIKEIVSSAPEVTAPRDALKVAIEEANRRVWAMPTDEGGYRPGSTVVAVLAHASGAEIAHVGDSRIYLLHSGAITQVTKDHSMVQEMVDRNIIKAEDAATHPDANKIMRALGIAKDVDVDLRPEPIPFAAGDVFILCSDGLSDVVGASEMLDIAGSRPAQQASGQLVDLANARGGPDNVTAMVVRMKGSAVVGDAATIVKTVAVTTHEAPPGRGTGTVISAPLAPPSSSPIPHAQSGGTALAAPLRHTEPQIARAEPITSPPPSSGSTGSRIALVFGIVIAVAALGAAGWFLYNENAPRHHNVVPLVVPEAGVPGAASQNDVDASTAEVTLAPVLAPPSGVKVPWWKDADAAAPTGENKDCVMARWQKSNGRPAASYQPLEAKCRAAGGVP